MKTKAKPASPTVDPRRVVPEDLRREARMLIESAHVRRWIDDLWETWTSEMRSPWKGGPTEQELAVMRFLTVVVKLFEHVAGRVYRPGGDFTGTPYEGT